MNSSFDIMIPPQAICLILASQSLIENKSHKILTNNLLSSHILVRKQSGLRTMPILLNFSIKCLQKIKLWVQFRQMKYLFRNKKTNIVKWLLGWSQYNGKERISDEFVLFVFLKRIKEFLVNVIKVTVQFNNWAILLITFFTFKKRNLFPNQAF